MERSRERILTTHAGSLPRPARLTELYAARAADQPIDESELAREAEAAVRAIVPRQVAAGARFAADAGRVLEHAGIVGSPFELQLRRRIDQIARVVSRRGRRVGAIAKRAAAAAENDQQHREPQP